MDTTRKKPALSVRDMAYIALMAALLAVCSWISIPAAVPFTMQTFAVFCAVGLLGGRRGSIAVLVYILLGAVGLPVFSGFRGGIGALLGATGGYIAGFLFEALIYWAVTALFGKKTWVMALGMVLGLAVCYAFGTAWFTVVYARSSGPIGFAAAAAKCVVPFILPDLAKIALALLVSRTVPRHIKIAEA